MKIKSINTFVINCFRTNWVFVKVETDEGTVQGAGIRGNGVVTLGAQ